MTLYLFFTHLNLTFLPGKSNFSFPMKHYNTKTKFHWLNCLFCSFSTHKIIQLCICFSLMVLKMYMSYYIWKYTSIWFLSPQLFLSPFPFPIALVIYKRISSPVYEIHAFGGGVPQSGVLRGYLSDSLSPLPQGHP